MPPSFPTLWTAIAPGLHHTRILVTDAGLTPALTAHLRTDPAHPRALPALLEALSLWQGATVCAALVADARSASFAPTLYHAAFPVFDAPPLYTLRFVDPPSSRSTGSRTRRGPFADLHRTLSEEAAR